MAKRSKRVFFGSRLRVAKIFGFTQALKEHSIYITSPHFSSFDWVSPGQDSQMAVTTMPTDGHLSVHRSGVAALRGESNKKSELRIVGIPLADLKSTNFGVRHLITALVFDPSMQVEHVIPPRPGDEVITGDVLKPTVFVFFAVPTALGSLEIQLGFHINSVNPELETPHMGWGAFALGQHTIAWIAYGTNGLVWPTKRAVLAYTDGLRVPIFIGRHNRQISIEYRIPIYTLRNNQLHMYLDTLDPAVTEEERAAARVRSGF
jgi:hypothetical protein